eukprot:CAMPEP_0170536052 /NCGR_PEP_ID=MMETSP0209-20121228/101936_1 /TAXON_ID=665100 ORGANISM="Litonotus pictus, Strain P1" /NCGR_SAMPLE_ID=MMETSP0209 /ASSEMBLY_ACC=CAM_ASM_000301 /LENGTH=487 /DNA_ID=CAMNT_0010837379 /DNA_START=111 /DNA_END=1574 /DNA_ORIENTATION=-
MTLLLIIAVSVLGFLFGQEIYIRAIPNASTSVEKLSYSRIEKSELPFMLAFVDVKGKNIPNILQYIEVETVSLTTIDSVASVKYSSGVHKCLEEDFIVQKEIMKEFLEEKRASNETLWCLNKNDLFFQNTVGSHNSTFVNIEIIKCSLPSNRTKHCPADTEAVTRQFWGKFYFLNSYLNPLDYTKPLNYYMDTFPLQFSSNFLKRSFLKFQKNVLFSDIGWILDHKVESSHIMLQNTREDISFSTTNNHLYWITLESPFFRTKVERHYMKVQELLAKIGGLFNAMFILLNVLLYNYVRFKYAMSVFEETWLKKFRITSQGRKDKDKISKGLSITNKEGNTEEDIDDLDSILHTKSHKNFFNTKKLAKLSRSKSSAIGITPILDKEKEANKGETSERSNRIEKNKENEKYEEVEQVDPGINKEQGIYGGKSQSLNVRRRLFSQDEDLSNTANNKEEHQEEGTIRKALIERSEEVKSNRKSPDKNTITN